MAPQARNSRRPSAPPVLWRAVRDPSGAWHVVDEHGYEVLKHPDPLVRLFNVWLVAAAPALRHELEWLTGRMERLILDGRSGQPTKDAQDLQSCWGWLMESLPPWRERARAADLSGQQELDLAAPETWRAL